MNVAADRAPFARPAIPIDNTAFSYHWSALKITRLSFFLSRRECESDFLALVDLDVPFFDIFYPPASLYPCCILAGASSPSQRGRKEARQQSLFSSPTVTD